MHEVWSDQEPARRQEKKLEPVDRNMFSNDFQNHCDIERFYRPFDLHLVDFIKYGQMWNKSGGMSTGRDQS